jgi:predicted metal-dependent hydrolase
MVIPTLVPALTRFRARRRPAAPTLVVRRPDIDYTPYGPAVWYADNVVATAMMTAYSALFPTLERFMADELRTVLPDLRDPELARAVRDFVGQESMHAHEHARSLAALTGVGYRVTLLERWFEATTRWVLRPLVRYIARPVCAAPGSIAVFAGVEHWTATMSEVVLGRRYPDVYNPIAALYYWHAAEEIEHKSVVADVLAHLGWSYPVRALMFLFGTLAFGLLSLFGTLVILVQIPALQGRGVIGWIAYPLRVVWDGIDFCLVREKMTWHVLWGTLRYLMPFYHPDGFRRERSTTVPAAPTAPTAMDELAASGLVRAVAAGAAPHPLRRADA